MLNFLADVFALRSQDQWRRNSLRKRVRTVAIRVHWIFPWQSCRDLSAYIWIIPERYPRGSVYKQSNVGFILDQEYHRYVQIDLKVGQKCQWTVLTILLGALKQIVVWGSSIIDYWYWLFGDKEMRARSNGSDIDGIHRGWATGS